MCEVIDSIGFVAKTFGGKEAQDGCGVPGYSSRDALEAVADAALPFFDLYLNGDSSAEERLIVALAPTRRAPSVDARRKGGSEAARTAVTGGGYSARARLAVTSSATFAAAASSATPSAATVASMSSPSAAR